jgi:uncharacterized protein
MQRVPYFNIWKDLAHSKPMVFLSGPRQAGKTTLAKQVAQTYSNSIYFNWDSTADKKRLIQNPEFFEQIHRKDDRKPLIIFDEIHKYRKWKNYLKGTYDKFNDRYHFLILGSGRLNVFQKGGDSLAGRYFQFNLWPLTLAELAEKRLSFRSFIKKPLQFIPTGDSKTKKIWKKLSKLSGFPEPYLSGKDTIYTRWSKNYHQLLLRQDIHQMTEIKNIDEVEILFSLLPERIGSPLSVASLARDLQISPTTAQVWIKTFESLCLAFLIKPWTQKITRALKKERKLYLFDYAEIPNSAAKFENMVALELLRAVSHWNDLGLGRFDLHYLRNREKEEVDFVLSNNHSPLLLVETKLSDENVSRNLLKFQNALQVPAVQLVQNTEHCRMISNHGQQVLVLAAHRWLPLLP